MTVLMRLATSRIGIVLLVFGALFAWHKIDKGSAVREAVVGYVAETELAAAEAETAALRRRVRRLEQANADLNASLDRAEQEAQDAESERRDYLERTPVPPADCAVGPDLLDLLRSQD